MTIEAILGDILTEIRALRNDLAVPPHQPVFYTPGPVVTDMPAPQQVFGAASSPEPVLPVVPPPPGHQAASAIPSHELSAALQADAQKLAALGQSGAAVLPNGTQLDKNGLPWDHRIHASSKALVADGSWRMKRGVDDALVKQVEAELRAAAAAPAAPAVPPTQWPFTAADSVAPPPPAAPAGLTFTTLAPIVAGKMADGSITVQQLTDALQAHGLPSFPVLATREDLVPGVAKALGL